MKEEKKMIDMTSGEYDDLMCKEFPELFQDRSKDMSQTCMCWGFSIGQGWYEILYDCCEKLEFIRKQTGLVAVFDQVKEKFGSARFYIHIDSSNCKEMDQNIEQMWCDFIGNTVRIAEDETDRTCGTCGEHYFHSKITMCGWVYDACEKCIANGKRSSRASDPVKFIEERKVKEDRIRKIKYRLAVMDNEDLDQIEVLVSKIDADREVRRAKELKDRENTEK